MTTHHIVCHDCQYEKMVDAEKVAMVAVEIHQMAHRHNIEYKEIQDA